MNQLIKDKLALLPGEPGCYLMKAMSGEVIYVGKAKVLKNRVKSYFMKVHNKRTQLLVSEIVDFEYIVTDNELEALILEMNLIKKYDPKFNVLLTDDKSYPYIMITAERHPRLLITRQVKKDKAKYFGPFPNAHAANETVRLLNKIYPLRKCNKLPDKVCLYAHIDQCLAPCVKEIDASEYERLTESISKFLKGDISDVKKELEVKMMAAAQKLDFERAGEYRDMVAHIELTVQKQQVSFADFEDRDVFGFAQVDALICVQVFFVRGGKIIERDVSIFNLINDVHDEVTSFIAWFYQRGNVMPKEIFVSEALDTALLSQYLRAKVIAPKIGSKKKLVDLAMKNAQVALEQKRQLVDQKMERTEGAIAILGRLLGVAAPARIEAYDNSHHAGQDAVSAMVVFKNGKPAKKEYRKYKIKLADTKDDYGMMKEVIYRRYFKVLNETLQPADLIVVDGGIGQIRVVRDVLRSLGFDALLVVGLVKDDKHRTRALIDGRTEQTIPFTPQDRVAFHLLTQIQEEVHRFVINFHRSSHHTRAFTSVLDDIPGIGPKRKALIIKTFKTVDQMQCATDEAYVKLGIPLKVAQMIKEQLNK
ncbi:MAG: excinuclease ABC subunit UvrC [Defluviitaleaceae bacterium]|nr:excinuclease ABC subunit UvrC [Defluviitaleaceae bacterium]